jgi:hypothetical protein
MGIRKWEESGTVKMKRILLQKSKAILIFTIADSFMWIVVTQHLSNTLFIEEGRGRAPRESA